MLSSYDIVKEQWYNLIVTGFINSVIFLEILFGEGNCRKYILVFIFVFLHHVWIEFLDVVLGIYNQSHPTSEG